MKVLLSFFIISLSLSATASDLEQVMKQTDSTISAAVSNIRFKCKCAVSFSVNWNGFTSAESARKATFVVENFSKAMPSFCADDGIPKACQIKNVRISYGLSTSSNFSAGTAEFVTDGITQHGFDSIIEKIEAK